MEMVRDELTRLSTQSPILEESGEHIVQPVALSQHGASGGFRLLVETISVRQQLPVARVGETRDLLRSEEFGDLGRVDVGHRSLFGCLLLEILNSTLQLMSTPLGLVEGDPHSSQEVGCLTGVLQPLELSGQVTPDLLEVDGNILTGR